MNYISLQLDEEARAIAGDLLNGLEDDEGWIKMTTRFAALIDTKLTDHRYIGIVRWFSDADFIEQEIEYR